MEAVHRTQGACGHTPFSGTTLRIEPWRLGKELRGSRQVLEDTFHTTSLGSVA